MSPYIDNRNTMGNCHKGSDNHTVRRSYGTNTTQVEKNSVYPITILDNRAIVNQILFRRGISSKISITDTGNILTRKDLRFDSEIPIFDFLTGVTKTMFRIN